MARFIINQFRDNALHLFKQQTYLNCQIFQLHTGSISQRFWSLLRFSGLDNKTNPRPKKCVENRPQLPKYAYIKNDIALPIILKFSPKLSNKHATVESKANHFTELSLKSPNPFDTISEIFKDKKPSNPWSPPDVPNIPDPCGQSCGKSPSCPPPCPPPCPTPCPPQEPVCPPKPCPPAPCPPPSCPSQNPCNNVYEGKAKTFFKKRSINFYTGSYWKSDSDLSLNKFYTIKSGFSTNEPTSLSKNVKSTKVARNWSSFIKDPDMNALEEGRALVKNQDAQKTVYQGPNSDKDSDKNRSFLMYADRKKQKKKNTSKAKDRNKHKKNIKVKKDLNNWQTSLNKQSKDQWKSSEDPKSSNVKTPWEPPRRFYSQYLTKRNPTLENSNLLITPIRSINSNKCLLKDDRKKKMEREKQETIKREMKEIEDCIVNVKCGKQKKKKDDDKLKKGNK